MTRDALLCICPRAPKLVITAELQTEINGYLSRSQTKSNEYNNVVMDPLAPLKFLIDLFWNIFLMVFYGSLHILIEIVARPIRFILRTLGRARGTIVNIEYAR